MRRIIDHHLHQWMHNPKHKPLLLRGARQVGKTHTARALGQNFTNVVEINFEATPSAQSIFQGDINIEKIIIKLSELTQKTIIPRKTLLFLDEIQVAPQALLALRYFYEQLPQLHIIAAGSLLEFAIEEVGLPVGRVSTLYMYPLTFAEFLAATGHKHWLSLIMQQDSIQPAIHNKLFDELGIYLATGGMPAAVNAWIETKNLSTVKQIQAELLFSYEQDFGKYAKNHQIKYLALIFSKAINQITKKFIYAKLGEYKKRELEPALQLLEKAGLLNRVIETAAQGIPIGAQAKIDSFKLIFLDVGLSQALLKLNLSDWILDWQQAFINKGEITESFVGQELLAYKHYHNKEPLFFWQRETRGSEAEVDYVSQEEGLIIPIEVKASPNKRIKSMHMFLDSHPSSPHGWRFWSGTFLQEERLISYPLYAIIRPLLAHNQELAHSLLRLIQD